MFELLLTVLAGYGLGSVPFGLVLTKAAGLGDIRAIGSGNIGATNVLRTGKKGLAAATLALDGIKAGVAVGLALWLTGDQDLGIAAGLSAIVGHNFPVWLKFKGGKGVATSLGTVAALAWPVAVASVITWLATAFLSRISSLSALVALALAPVYAYLFADIKVAAATLALSVLGIARHHANIKRLLNGTEPKIGQKK